MATFTPVTISNISYSNTFGQWVTTTNSLVIDHNNFVSNGYIKSTGTLYLNDSSLGLQTSNATVQGYFQVAGVGSSAYVQNNLRVDSQVYFTNTILGLTNTGQANIGGLLLALGSNTGLAVSNNTTIGGYLNVSGNTNISNTLTVASTTTIGGATTVSNTVSISGTTTISNNAIVSQNTTVGHYLSVGNDISAVNEYLSGNETVLGTSTINNIQANNANVGVLTGQTLVTPNTLYANVIQANTTITTNNFSVGSETIRGTSTINALTVNTAITASNTQVSSTFGNAQILGQLAINGNFVLNGTTVYNTNTFVISANTSVAQNNAVIAVGRGSTGANASIRWNESQAYWDILDVNNSNYYRILTNEYLTDNLISTSTTSIATANMANYLYNISNNISIVANASFARANLGVVSVTSNVNSPVIVTGNTLYPNLNLTSSGVTAGSYGNTTTIPTVTVDVYGRVTALSNNTVSSSLSTSANTGTGSVSLLNQTLQIISSNTQLVNITASGNSFTITPQTSGVTPGTYGSASAIPTVTVDAAGRVQAISTNAVSSTLSTSANTGTGSVNLTNQTLQIISSNTSLVNITASGNSFTISHPNSGVTSGSYGSATAVPVFTVDAAGRVQSATTAPIAIPLSQVTSGLGTSVATTLGNAAGAAGGFATYNQLGSAAFTATTAYQAAGTYLGAITYGNHSNSNYQILWGSGNAAYGTDYLFVNPSSGALYSYNNITAYYSSDKKFKENIRPIPNALNMVTEIGGKLYDWKDEYLKEQNTPDEYFMRKSDFGVIAQDLIKAGFEVAVRERPDGSLAVDYEKLCALAFQAIAELKQEVDELKK